jgi:hypothetical protein
VLSAAILVVTAFVAGVTGAWSPCGFSMVETLGSAAPRLGARVIRASCATFALGALAGGALTFTALGALGRLLGADDHAVGLVAAVAIALLAALGEALGVRVVPQIRRQVPEPWRRVLPLPLAAGLYGVLLGLGFTTFVLTLAVWALAGIAVAIGSPLAGLAIGIGFGLGRALPVVVMAPRYATLGGRLEIRMAEQPQLLRRLRLTDATLLAVLALSLLVTGTASAARLVRVAGRAVDPSLAAGALAWQGPNGKAWIQRGDARMPVAAQDLALGGPYLAARTGNRIAVTDLRTGKVVAQLNVHAATQLAVSAHWLVWRGARPGGGDHLYAAALPALGSVRLVAGAGGRERLSRPELDGNRLVYAIATRTSSRIVVRNLATNSRNTVLRSTLTQLGQPALRGPRLLYVDAGDCSQRLMIVRLHGRRRARTLLTIGSTAHRDSGHEPSHTTQGREPSLCPQGTPHRTDTILWTTALGPGAAYVTLLRPTGPTLARMHA